MVGALKNAEAPVESERDDMRGGDGDTDDVGDSSIHGSVGALSIVGASKNAEAPV